MPTEILLMRHGESTGNVAGMLSRGGDHSLFTELLRNQNSSSWPLTEKGVQQARNAGSFIRNSGWSPFDGYYCSDYVRAIETASNLRLEGASWTADSRLRERNWAGLERLSFPEMLKIFSDQKTPLVENSIDWHPPGGESMRSLLLRLDLFLADIRKRHSGQRVIIVSHGGIVHAMLLMQHGLGQTDYQAFIHNHRHVRYCHLYRYFDKGICRSGTYSKCQTSFFEKNVWVVSNNLISNVSLSG
jgi:broad specificity phosphatase PhoE